MSQLSLENVTTLNSSRVDKLKIIHDQAELKDGSNPALYTTKDHRIYMGESKLDRVGDDQALVHMMANGICGSDVHFWKAGEIGEVHVDGDYVLGHEGAGRVVQVGKNVKNVAVGDRVSVEPGVPCENCIHCSEGEYNLCRSVAFTGAYPYDGSIRRFHLHKASFLHKLPDSMSYQEGAMLEPLSVVLHAFERAPVGLGRPCIIFGAGPIGLIALACARASGAFPLLICDIVPGRLEVAKRFISGCDTFQIDTKRSPFENGSAIEKVFQAYGCSLPRTTFECTGVDSSVATAVWATRRSGTVMVVGVGKQTINNLPFMEMSMGEKDLKFINRYNHSWPNAIRLMQSGYVNIRPLVTHTFSLSQAVQALEFVSNPANGGIKIQILDESVQT